MTIEEYQAAPQVWWLWLRRSLENMNIHHMNAEQWALADSLSKTMTIKPITAALKIARLTHDVTTGREHGGWFYRASPKGQQ